MGVQTFILLVLVILCLALAIYSEWLIKLRFAPIQWTIPLRRVPRKDLGIFTVLLFIVLIQQMMQPEHPLTGGLLLGLIVLTIWFGWIRQPVVLVNAEGLVIKGTLIGWLQITRYQLTQEGELILHLLQGQVSLKVKNIDDLERLYQHILAQPAGGVNSH